MPPTAHFCAAIGSSCTRASPQSRSGAFVYYFVRGDYRMMRRLTDEARQVYERLPNPVIRLASHRLAGITAMHFGAFPDARSELDAILQMYDWRQHRSQPVHYVHDPK